MADSDSIPSAPRRAPYYEHGGITIYHGDCREILLNLSADALVMDPPYGIAWNRGLNSARWSKSQPGIVGDGDTSVRDAVLAGWLPRPAIVFGSDLAPKPDATRQTLYWLKPNDAGVYGSYLGFRRDVELVFLLGNLPKRPPAWSSVLRSAIPSIGNPTSPAGKTGHPHAKPVDLMRQLVLITTGIIADPFMGSGSTLVAAKELGRQAIGIEIEERYCEIAARRLSQEVLPLECGA